MRRAAAVLFVLAGAAGCADATEKACADATARYQALLARGTLPRSKDFDPLLSALDAVPKGGRGSACAATLAGAIRTARGNLFDAPLARGGAAPEQPDPCEPLAQALGRATGPERETLRVKTETCRREVLDKKAEECRHDGLDEGAGH